MKGRSLWTLSALGALAFVALAVIVKSSTGVERADLSAALWVNHFALGSTVSTVLIWASLYGREYFWVGVVGVMFLFGDRRTKLLALGLCGVFVAGIGVGYASKDIVARARPDQVLGVLQVSGTPVVRIPLDTDFAFPSGHAVIVSIGAVYSLLTMKRRWVSVLLTLEAAVVCFSRVYLFEHFPTDVVAGIAVGAAVALAGLAIEERYLRGVGGRIVDALVKVFRDGPLGL